MGGVVSGCGVGGCELGGWGAWLLADLAPCKRECKKTSHSNSIDIPAGSSSFSLETLSCGLSQVREEKRR